ncbi:hypothetical protein [Gemmatimonas sp.]|uniref:hypothetical protein n=2 Tax=Gemmatimonas sp. TaxID=1962908 RepID=UPI0035656D3E
MARTKANGRSAQNPKNGDRPRSMAEDKRLTSNHSESIESSMKSRLVVLTVVRSVVRGRCAAGGILLASMLGSACGTSQPDMRTEAQTLDTVGVGPRFAHTEKIQLEETRATLIVEPFVHLSNDTTILLADPRAVRVAHFQRTGKLVWEFAQRGDSAGLLRVPIALAKTQEGYWVADAMNGLMLFDSAAARFVRKLSLPNVAVQDMVALNDTTLLIGGPTEALSQPKPSWLRAIDTRSGIERWSAPSPTLVMPKNVVNSYSRTRIAMYHERIVASNSVIDTLFLLDAKSGLLLKSHFMNLQLHVPSVLRKATSRLRSEQLGELTRVSTVALIDENHFLAEVARGSGQAVRYTPMIGDLRASTPRVISASKDVILGARDGVFITQVIDAIQRNHLDLHWGRPR